MKKSFALALVLAALMLVTVMAVSVSADASISIGEVVVEKDIDNNLVTVTVPYTAVDVPQITLLATKGGADAAPEATETNIVYVAQQESTVGSFTFSVYYDEFSAELPYMWIKVGGTSIETAEGASKEVWETIALVIYGDVNDDGFVNGSDVTLLTAYVNVLSAEDELPENLFPGGELPSGPVPAKLTDDDVINGSDVSLLTAFVNTLNAEEELSETLFPNGKFPGDKQ